MTYSNAVSFHDHTIWIATPEGERLGIADDFIRLSYTLTQNTYGALSLIVPAASKAGKLLSRLDARIYVMRDMRIEGETCWFIRTAPRYFTDADGARFYEVKAPSALYLLAGRTVPYANEEAQATKTGNADNVIKAVAREHIGASAAAARQVAGLSVQSDLSLGPSVTQSFQYMNALRVCQNIADATKDSTTPSEWVYFDIVVKDWLTGSLEFRTYVGSRGRNHGLSSDSPVVFSDLAGTLVEAEREYDHHDEVTYVYAVTPGDISGTFSAEGSDETRLNASSLNRREVFVEGPAGYSPDVELAPALAAGRPRLRFRANLQDLPGLRYGLQWNVGDIVSCTFGGITNDYRIDSVTITVEGGRETIDANLEADVPL